MKNLRVVNGWFLDKDSGQKPMCAFKKEEFCTPDCAACDIDNSLKKATCLRGPFVFATIVED
jgi:hypothetical protein